MTKVWDDGATYVLQGTVVNNGAISTVSITLEPGAGNEFELHYATISHNDATASTIVAIIRDDGGRTLITLANLALVQQNIVLQLPPLGTVVAVGAMNFPELVRPIMISGEMDLRMSAVDIDDTEGITFSIVGRLWGGLPTLTTQGGGAETVTFNTNKPL